jgi:hypothetical protein
MMKWSRNLSIAFFLLRSDSAPVKSPPAIASTTAAPTYAKIVTPPRTTTIVQIRPGAPAGGESRPLSVEVTTVR